MGCNTSKESVPAAEGQDKEKQENGDVNNKAEGNNVANSGESRLPHRNCIAIFCGAFAIGYLAQTCTSGYQKLFAVLRSAINNGAINPRIFP